MERNATGAVQAILLFKYNLLKIGNKNTMFVRHFFVSIVNFEHIQHTSL